MKIGFVGQGFIGKSYADDMECRGYKTVRYALEEPYVRNKHAIAECDVVFIAVPTPTTPRGFDYSIVESALKLVGKGKIAVIKSTILPGTTRHLQKKSPKVFVMHSPEFLVLKQAAEGAARPFRNIIGIPSNTKAFRTRAAKVLKILPKTPFSLICSSEEAELIKYAGNFFLYLKVLFGNLIYETAGAVGAEYELVRKAIAADPRIGPSHLQVFHDSGHKGARRGRGAGGACFIKDIVAFATFYKKTKDPKGLRFIEAAIEKNVALLLKSGKDLDLLRSVYRI